MRELLRDGAVSIISTATSAVVLGLLVATRTPSPGWANVTDPLLFATRSREPAIIGG